MPPWIYCKSFPEISVQGAGNNSRPRAAGSQSSTSRVLWKLSGAMLRLYVLVMGVSAFTLQPAAHTGAARSCRFRGRHYKREFRLEGEPVALRCPQVPYWLWASVSPRINLTWHKNDSARTVPGEEETRMWAQDGALWLLPALQEDSGTYVCTTRNASYCDKMSIELRVFENTDAFLPFISYPQILTLSTSGVLVCPDLSEFTRDKTDVKIQWYKDSLLLDKDNEKFLSVRGTTHLLVHDVALEDAGYYRCVLTFAHEGQQYNITRSIELRIKKKKEETIPVIISPLKTISASLGSRLTIPCKVFLGTGTPLTTMLWWTANDTHIESAYPGGRVTEGPRHVTTV
ncbi:interleukin-1 receptor type 2 isoform X5 [Homo sapiens]|uniref:interleukin-1 receptor type 2 isoform X5 n=1 Tax=Homo sapiens TaxID=9606 RepID=UPI0005D01589|nr:interleukin-1 receptor type 2 isoform X5 [Homo sapiens]XP_054199808.1 interleukin-1 receptor type 2 isoform X5 [Homo sapiens]